MTSPTDYTEKVAKLLAQAEGNGVTEAEAEVFLLKAQELATLHSIDLAKARHLTVAKERTTPVQRTITLGVRGTRGLNTLVSLFGGIARANDITYNIARKEHQDFASNIDLIDVLPPRLYEGVLTPKTVDAANRELVGGDWIAVSSNGNWTICDRSSSPIKTTSVVFRPCVGCPRSISGAAARCFSLSSAPSPTSSSRTGSTRCSRANSRSSCSPTATR